MKLIIYRGTHEIGGSCLEFLSNSGCTRLISDIGLPLVNADRSPFDWDTYRSLPADQLIDEKILPQVKGLYKGGKPSVAAVLLSHAHLDHYGLVKFVHSDIPVYMSSGTKSLAEVSNVFLGTSVELDRVQTFIMWEPFEVGEFTITPYLVDHSAPDSAAFLIEGDRQRVFYTGDFRGHGRKRVLLERLITDGIRDVDCLIMEGSMIGRDAGKYPDETAVENAIYEVIVDQLSYTFAFCSSQNIDRLVSIYRAVKRAHKTLVMDLYTAFVLDKLSSISKKIPQFDWSGIRVLYAYSHAEKLAKYDKSLLYKYKKAKIEWDEIQSKPEDTVILSKDNRFFRLMIRKLGVIGKAKAIYSMWQGYLARTDLSQVLDSYGIELVEIHTSGHAYIEDLKKLASAIKPNRVVPIHTFHPDKYDRIYSNIVQLDDGQILDV